MDQRIAIVTGASSGIGLEIARGLVQNGFHVVLAVRDVERGARAAKAIGGGEVMALDLSDLASVRAFAAGYLARHATVELLVNNAGIHVADRQLTRDGFELTMATNHIGHFLLTNLLLDALKEGAPSRVVNIASEAHRFARTLEPELDLRAKRDGWSGLVQYSRSKLANLMFTYALARRVEGTGVVAHAAHPGSVRSGWARGRESGAFRLVAKMAAPLLLSPASGARTPLHAATAPELAYENGRYLVRMRPAKSTRLSRNIEVQERLWAASEGAVKL